jgi:predicted SAM-dependent methyltransferase
MTVKNFVAFPGDISAENEAFLEKNWISMSMYRHMQEVKLCDQGTMTMNDTCLTISKMQGFRAAIPNEYFLDQILMMKSMMGSGGVRHICFQSDPGLIITFDMDGLLGNYSRFRA